MVEIPRRRATRKKNTPSGVSPRGTRTRATYVHTDAGASTDGPRVEYVPRPDASPESEAEALAQVYRYLILDRHVQKKSAEASGGEDGVEGGDNEHGLDAASD